MPSRIYRNKNDLSKKKREKNCTKLLILQGTYFLYYGDYSAILEKFFEKWGGNSRWLRNDHIIFVPENENMKKYVIATYQNVIPRA